MGYEINKKAGCDSLKSPQNTGPEFYIFAVKMTEDHKAARKTQRTSRFSTVISISLSLFITGMLGILLLHAHKLGRYVRENIELSLIIKPEADSLAVGRLLENLKGTPSVRSAKYVSKEEAALLLQKELGEDFISFLGYNPLYASIDVGFNADFTDELSIRKFSDSMRSNPLVSEVQYQPSLVDSINRNVRTISWILFGFSVLLVLVAIALINNTIRISLYARRLLIKSMLLVGATKWFILQPFLVKSIWNGLISGMIAIGLMAGLLYFATLKVPELGVIQDFSIVGYVAAGLILLGILLSFICTLLAVNRYLRYRTTQIY